MTEWLLASVVLLLWTVAYCLRKSVADYRSGRTDAGFGGVVAFAGALSTVADLPVVIGTSLWYH